MAYPDDFIQSLSFALIIVSKNKIVVMLVIAPAARCDGSEITFIRSEVRGKRHLFQSRHQSISSGIVESSWDKKTNFNIPKKEADRQTGPLHFTICKNAMPCQAWVAAFCSELA